MNEKKICGIAQSIVKAEREIALGKDVKSNEDKIQIYMQNLSPYDLIKVVLKVEKMLDNKEKF